MLVLGSLSDLEQRQLARCDVITEPDARGEVPSAHTLGDDTLAGVAERVRALRISGHPRVGVALGPGAWGLVDCA